MTIQQSQERGESGSREPNGETVGWQGGLSDLKACIAMVEQWSEGEEDETS